MDEDGHERRVDSHRPGGLGMLEVGEITQGEHPLIPRVEIAERGSDDLALIGLVDGIEIVDGNRVVEAVGRPAGPVAAASPLPAKVVGQLVGRDTEYPRSEATRSPTKPRQRSKGLLECG